MLLAQGKTWPNNLTTQSLVSVYPFLHAHFCMTSLPISVKKILQIKFVLAWFLPQMCISAKSTVTKVASGIL